MPIYTPGQEEPEKKLVQGQNASSLEWRIALALDYLGYDYIFQYEVFAGRRLRGGQVIDFWVFTVPKPTPIYAQGSYWHKEGSMTDDYKVKRLYNAYNGQIKRPLLIWENEVPSIDAAIRILRNKL